VHRGNLKLVSGVVQRPRTGIRGVRGQGLLDTYFEWALSISEDPGVLTLIDELPVRSQQPNLIFAACRFLGVEPGPTVFCGTSC